MTNDCISFACPACGIKLTVPATLAGVIGPCPSCGSQIQAPNLRSPAPTPVIYLPTQSEIETAQPHAAGIPHGLKPESRQLPHRSAPPEVNAKPMPEPISTPSVQKASPVSRHPHDPSIFSRIALLLVFGLLALALIYGALTILNKQEKSQTAPTIESSVSEPINQSSPPAEKSPQEKTFTPPAEVPSTPATALPTPPPVQPELSNEH